MPEKEKLINCAMDCPNRKTSLGKGYAYLFAIAVTALLCWQSVDVKYTKSDGLEWQTKEVPVHLLVGYLFLVGSSLGFNTDALAVALGNALSQGRRLE